MIRVMLPYHLRNLAQVGQVVELHNPDLQTLGAVLDALESQFPVLGGTIRDHRTRQRRPFIRFFASGEDLSLEGWDVRLPDDVLSGAKPLRIVGAMAGG